MNPRKYLIPGRYLRGEDDVRGYIRLKGDRSKVRGQTVSECPRRIAKEVSETLAHHAQQGGR